jgi:hypothetical protein
MSNHARPLLLGYIRADAMRNGTQLDVVKGQLEAFADREAFSLGTIYVAHGDAPAAFHAVVTEVAGDETAWGVVVPDLRHVTVVEQLVLNRHEAGARVAVLAASFSPRADGPGVGTPTRARPVVPPRPHVSSSHSTNSLK